MTREASIARIDLGADADVVEFLYEQEWTDGLPMVPPTEERVEACLRVLGMKPDQVIGVIPPGGGIATAEKIAANAVMAGCRPECLPVVVAAVEAMLDARFNLYGVAARTLG